MLFNSFVYTVLFLPVVLTGFFVIGRFSDKLAASFLALASLVFYAYWDSRYVALLLASVLINYGTGLAMSRAKTKKRARLLAILGIGTDLAILGWYKYTDFFITSINGALGTSIPIIGIILPLGISFFTFTQIAFIADVYKGGVREYRFMHYLLFVTYFPHLIAGPILHHKEMMPQFADERTYTPRIDMLRQGTIIFLIGLAKKILLADTYAGYANAVFNAAALGHHPDVVSAWLGTLGYTLQIYFDFSGYTDMAVGTSLLFGIRLPLNFNSPYKSLDIIDFWRRWHMTLSRFLRDYLYIPLGGNRKGPVRRYMNLMITMLLGGLWHGASWTFIVWGALHGLFLAINHAWNAVMPSAVPSAVRKLAAGALTFVAVSVAWVFFRAPTFQTASTVIQAMSGFTPVHVALSEWSEHWATTYQLVESGLRSSIMVGVGLAICWLCLNSQELGIKFLRLGIGTQWRMIGGAAVSIMVLLAINSSRGVSEFIYFTF